MDICNNHLFGLILIVAILMAGLIVSIIKDESEVE
tara:strand:+ start:1000 stop:1104 length:105 start_codon:yes stop_codon:yes gene_type:complete